MKLHASGEDYLETILVLQKKLGMVRSVDVARHMEVSKPSVCHAVATLRDGGFLTMDSDYFLHLTDVGRAVAEKIYERHCFFTEQLIAAGVDPETAEADACRIEHIISDESFSRLKEADWSALTYTGKGRFSMVQAVTYQSDKQSVYFQGKLIVLENLTPVLSPEEKKKRKREIENNPYDIFSKYGDRFR